MRKPKIAIVVSHPIQHFCPQYVSYANNEDWEIKVFFASSIGLNAFSDKDFGQNISWNNLQLNLFPHEFLNSQKAIPINSKLDAPELTDKLDNYNADIVIVHGYSQKYQRRAYNWAKTNKKKVFFVSDSENRRKRSVLKLVLKYLFLRFYFKSIDAFLSVGDANEQYYRTYGVNDKKLYRTFFPIDIKTYNSFDKTKDFYKEQIREKYNLPANIITACYVGKLIGNKDQMHLINLLKELEEYSKNEIVIFILGSGPDYNLLQDASKSLKRHKVVLTGFVAPENLPYYYAASDIYLHPSRKDAHSLAISEAIYMGCVPIVSNLCGSYGPSDDVRPGFNGFICKYGDIKQLSKLLTCLAENLSLLNRFKENSISISRCHQKLAHGEGLKSAIIDVTI